MNVEVDQNNISVVLDRINKQIIANVKKAVWDSGQGVKTKAQKNLIANHSIDAGGLYGSVQSIVDEDGMGVTIGTGMNLGAWIEFGGSSTPENAGKPHKVSKEGRKQIAEWAVRKLGVSQEESMSVANAIAWKIQLYGQKPKPWLFPAFESEKPNIQKRIEKAIQDGVR